MPRTYFWLLSLVMLSVTTPVFAEDNQLSAEEKADGWELLFNGKDFTGWKCSNGKEIATPIEEGAIVPYKSGGYLVIYDKPFADFILKCDVKMSDPCNSGIFLRVADLKNPVHTGFEIQVNSGKGSSRHDFGAIYDLVAPSKNAAKGPGSWETVEIKCQGAKLSVKVNGEQVSQIDCEQFTEPGKRLDGTNHKFKLNKKPIAVKDFAREGYLGFQDHGAKVWYKNIKLKQL